MLLYVFPRLQDKAFYREVAANPIVPDLYRRLEDEGLTRRVFPERLAIAVMRTKVKDSAHVGVCVRNPSSRNLSVVHVRHRVMCEPIEVCDVESWWSWG